MSHCAVYSFLECGKKAILDLIQEGKAFQGLTFTEYCGWDNQTYVKDDYHILPTNLWMGRDTLFAVSSNLDRVCIITKSVTGEWNTSNIIQWKDVELNVLGRILNAIANKDYYKTLAEAVE